MANLSDAMGNVTIKTNNGEAIKSLIEVFKVLERGDYNTYISDSDMEIRIDENGNAEFELHSYFWGTGRWSYSSNIECFAKWSMDEITEECKSILSDNDWSIVFDYSDSESGCGLLIEAVVEIKHSKGDSFDKFEIINGEYTEYKFTGENLVKLDYFDSMEDFLISEVVYDFDLESELDFILEKCGNVSEEFVRQVYKENR